MNYEAAMEDFSLCKEVSPALAKDVDRSVQVILATAFAHRRNQC